MSSAIIKTRQTVARQTGKTRRTAARQTGPRQTRTRQKGRAILEWHRTGRRDVDVSPLPSGHAARRLSRETRVRAEICKILVYNSIVFEWSIVSKHLLFVYPFPVVAASIDLLYIIQTSATRVLLTSGQTLAPIQSSIYFSQYHFWSSSVQARSRFDSELIGYGLACSVFSPLGLYMYYFPISLIFKCI